MLKLIFFQLVFILAFCASTFAQKNITGTITSASGKLFTISCDKVDEIPSAKDTCDVSKDISGTKNPFGINIQSGWMSVADAVFVSRKENALSFKVVRETSDVVINGKKQEHLVKGKKLKIVWK
jgi:hypothetical protein